MLTKPDHFGLLIPECLVVPLEAMHGKAWTDLLDEAQNASDVESPMSWYFWPTVEQRDQARTLICNLFHQTFSMSKKQPWVPPSIPEAPTYECSDL